MKSIRNILSSSLICMPVILLFMTSCIKNEDESINNDEEMEAYEHVLNLQDEVDSQLDIWFTNMDSLDAIARAQQEFANDPGVSSAIISSQGISVQYANGMRGGIFLNPKDDISEISGSIQIGPVSESENHLKSTVNQKKMILLDPHYWERNYYTDQIYSHIRSNLQKVNIDLSTFYKNEEATVDRFTQLSGYGIIQIYSHGLAWPKQENITDVYLLTGETANEATSKKYWDELKTGNIPIMMVEYHSELRKNVYLISESFVNDYNDFSEDTVLFYGGFCYSFLGNWPDIIDGFADGAYLGHDWSVYTHKNANWLVNSIYYLSDTTADRPVTLNDWFNKSDVSKLYWNEKDSRYVHIYYAGDGNLKLWDNVRVSLIVLSSDGKPVSNPGETGTVYGFRCEAETDINPLEYVWDIGDGSSPVTASKEVNITWKNPGVYQLSVIVKNKNNGAELGRAQLMVSIVTSNNDVVDFVTSCPVVSTSFTADAQFSPSYIGWGGFSSHVIVDWSGLSFDGTLEESDLGNIYNYTISGTLSSDGQKVSYEASTEYKWVVGEQVLAESSYTISVTDYPLSMFDPEGDVRLDPYASYGSIYSGPIDVQQYVNNFEGYVIDNEGTHTVTGVDWDNVTMLCIQFSKE